MGINIQVGQLIPSLEDLAGILECDISRGRTSMQKELRHYCNFHKEDKYTIKIDEVFETPIPFNRDDFEYEIGQEIETKHSVIKILDRCIKHKYGPATKNSRVYICTCLKHKDEQFELIPNQISKGAGCPICGRKKLLKGKSLYDLRPDLLQYLKNPDEAKDYGYKSGKKITCVCPVCGSERSIAIGNLTQYKFTCPICSDGISYPNRLVTNVLLDLGLQLEREKSFEWSQNRIYDIYIPEYNMIIENHGGQHYEERFRFSSDKTLREQKQNDTLKRKIALQNGINYYIVINCAKSELSYIKKNIMKSPLPILLHFSEQDVDWEKCHKEACVPLEHIAWDLWNQGHYLDYICKELYVSDVTARTYVNKGIDAGVCQKREAWQVKEELYTKKNFKPIYNITDGIYFSSRFEYEKAFPDFFPGKSGSFNLYAFINKNKLYKGKQLIYITQEEYNRVYEQSLSDPAVKVYGNPFDI